MDSRPRALVTAPVRGPGLELLHELADLVVAGIRDERFVMMLGLDEAAATLRSRADALEQGELPLTKAHLS